MDRSVKNLKRGGDAEFSRVKSADGEGGHFDGA